ncbi:MAG: ABC transporter substrate-binding protein [Promicromonosporaceae bacterium]|nr:ABC transporter substrate-binding protein [Promicromonosporaceae bacterium]
MPSHAPTRPRRTVSALVGTTAVVGLAGLLGGCSGLAQAESASTAPSQAPTAALPTTVPAGTTLTVGDPTTQFALQLAGKDIDAPFDFKVTWANISGGPQSLEAFRARSLDVSAVAEIPSLQATWTGLPVRNIAALYRQNWDTAPIYELAAAPGVKLATLADLKGKKIAYSPGQAQGALVLKSLAAAHLTQKDVTLVELPSTGDVYATTLASKQVDVAPIGGTTLEHYLAQYGKDGATAIDHHLRDDAGHLYAPDAVLDDPAKLAALREYVVAWAKAKVWIYDHPDLWKQKYDVENQGLSEADAQYLIDHAPVPDIPQSWAAGIQRTQATADLLSKEQGRPHIDVAGLFDQRFAAVAYQAAQEQREADGSAK